MDQHEIIVDSFAGGGGASLGIEMALGRSPDVAINHDPEAISMHTVNHPDTEHYCQNVWQANPVEVANGRPVGLAWFSPDCKHFSKAKGATPKKRNIRDLAWVVDMWAQTVEPRVMVIENVEEFEDWCPLVAIHEYEDGTEVDAKHLADGTYHDRGRPRILPDGSTAMRPDDSRKGETFKKWVNALRRRGYKVQWRQLRACDYGAPTIRKRLFVVARRDGEPIVWPKPTHGDPRKPGFEKSGLLPWRTAAEVIDWSQPCPSIFMTPEEVATWKAETGQRVKRPLAEATMKRIAQGLKRFVIDAAEPFIIKPNHKYKWLRGQRLDEPLQTATASNDKALITPYLTECANATSQRTFDASEPMRTQCANVKGGHFAVVAPTLVQTGYGEREGQAPRAPGLDKPLGTIVAGGGKHALVQAFMAKHFGGVVGCDLRQPSPTVLTRGTQNQLVAVHMERQFGKSGGNDATEPVATVTAGGSGKTAVVASNLVKLRGTCKDGQPTDAPVPTITASGTHVAEVRAFLMKYYGTGGVLAGCDEPMHTIVSKDRMGLVTVNGEDYEITDIGMRMLDARELFRAQGFHDGYEIDVGANGERFSKTVKVRACGNSVSPPLAAALVSANYQPAVVRKAAE